MKIESTLTTDLNLNGISKLSEMIKNGEGKSMLCSDQVIYTRGKTERTYRAGPKRSPVFDIFFNSTPVYVTLEKEIVSSVPISMERLNMISTSYFIYNFSFLSIAD
jgi:hypothetical protein